MSKLDRLSILGVRSFDNKRSEALAFQTPLTLIVGPNGSGKTTIIECLKYAATGDLPAYSKGGNFVHDPKLCGEKEVLAQVKMSFRSIEGTRMVCTRSQQLTVKKTSRSCKTIDGTLKITRDGQTTTLSNRNVELNSMMPHYLGVSKAVLESVIFCHQEDSLWPLEDSKKLKERFDALFEAVKYTKAIDSIKVIRKGKMTELIKMTSEEEHSKIIKTKAEQNEKRTKELWKEMEKAQAKRDELGELEREAADKSQEFREKAAKVGEIVGQLIGKRIEQRSIDESVQFLRQRITEVTDSDEDLERMLAQYEERVDKLQDDLDAQKERYGSLGRDVKDTRARISAKEYECGTYEAQKQHYDQQVEHRERLVKETSRSHNIRGFDLEVDDAQVQAFIERITKMARDQNAAFERARRETHEETQEAQKVLNNITHEQTTLNNSKESAKKIIATNDGKIGNLQTQLNQIDVDEGRKATMESNLRDIEQKLELAKSDIGSAEWDKSIAAAEAELHQAENRKDKLSEELMEGTRQAGDSARLDFVRKELKDRETSLQTMEGAHGDKISSILGQRWNAESIEKDYQSALQQAGSQVAEAERQRDGITREKEHVEFQWNGSKSDLKSKREALSAAEKAIRSGMQIEPEDYPDTVKDYEASRDIAKSDAAAFSGLFEYFDSCLKTANDHNGCRTCARQFKNPQEVEKMRKTIETERKRIEGSGETEKDLKEAEEALKEARALSSEYDTWKKAKAEIPSLEQVERKLMQKRDQLLRQLEDQDAVVSVRQGAKRDIEAISKTVQRIANYSGEIASFKTQIEALAAKQKSAGLSRGLETIQEDIKNTDAEMKEVRARLNKSTGDRDRSRTTINNLEREQSDIKSKLSAVEYQLEKKRSVEAQVEEYKGLNDEQREAIKSFEQNLRALKPQEDQAKAKFDDVVRRGADKDRELQAETTKINSSLTDLKKADHDVKAYIDKGGPEQLARGKREAQDLRDQVARMEDEQGMIVKHVKRLETEVNNHGETKRNISDNQKYRRDLRQLKAVEAEIEELEMQDVEKDKEEYERKGHKWEVERNKRAGERAQLTGSLGSMDHQLNQLRTDYETDYKDAAKKHKECHIKVETTKACVEDLARYASALDKAVMKYHSLKMDEINNFISELWRSTYQGTDVDTIMICSESEGATNSRSHNYRVVMVKQDAEMDMRGRCSAGQKVLASIIIRLALAECFAKNCGIIALDEPTTNLDTHNIGALAESLHKIIQERRTNANFQLVVITHDEEFLRKMNCGDFADTYYRVSRDERQKSIIERQNISEVI